MTSAQIIHAVCGLAATAGLIYAGVHIYVATMEKGSDFKGQDAVTYRETVIAILAVVFVIAMCAVWL